MVLHWVYSGVHSKVVLMVEKSVAAMVVLSVEMIVDPLAAK